MAARLTNCEPSKRQEFADLAAAAAERVEVADQQFRMQSGDNADNAAKLK